MKKVKRKLCSTVTKSGPNKIKKCHLLEGGFYKEQVE